MRTGKLLLAACSLFLVEQAIAHAHAPKTRVELVTPYLSPGLTLAEAKTPVHGVRIVVEADAKGEGKGKLTLQLAKANYDDYGDYVTGRETDNVDRARKEAPVPPVELDCEIEFVKEGAIGRVNEAPTKRAIFKIKGPKLTSPLFIATTGPGLTSGRLLVHDKEGRVEHVLEMHEVKPYKDNGAPQVPCHPGCFPAGTLVQMPEGTQRIETLRKGDTVTTIGENGKASKGVVQELFTTTNKLFEVKTADATALTTDAQPLCLEAGGMRKAGDLKAGDRIWLWKDGKRKATTVQSVTATGRITPVYNLIVGDSAVFVANGFLARGKPPAEGSKGP